MAGIPLIQAHMTQTKHVNSASSLMSIPRHEFRHIEEFILRPIGRLCHATLSSARTFSHTDNKNKTRRNIGSRSTTNRKNQIFSHHLQNEKIDYLSRFFGNFVALNSTTHLIQQFKTKYGNFVGLNSTTHLIQQFEKKYEKSRLIQR